MLQNRLPSHTALTIVLLLAFTVATKPGIGYADASDDTSKAIRTSITYQPTRYLMGPGDVIALTVLHEPEFSQDELLIGPDGYINIAGIGDVYVANKTMPELTAIVQERLRELIIDPKIALCLVKMRPITVYLAGAVKHPGMFQFDSLSKEQSDYHTNKDENTKRTDMRLTNVLANAGGVALNADLSNITIKRADSDKVETVNLWALLKNGAVDQDIWITPGDYITVPEVQALSLPDEDLALLLKASFGPKEFPIRVVGFVNKPGLYYLNGESSYLNSALASAEGYRPEANKNTIVVRRFTNENKFYTFFVDPRKNDINLRPNDVIYVAEQKTAQVARIGEHINKMLSPFQTAGQAAYFGKHAVIDQSLRRINQNLNR